MVNIRSMTKFQFVATIGKYVRWTRKNAATVIAWADRVYVAMERSSTSAICSIANVAERNA